MASLSPMTWLLVGAAFVLLALLVILRRTRRRMGARPAPPVRVTARPRGPVRPLEPEEMAAVPFPVRACPECGSPSIRPLSAGEGGIAGFGELLDRQRCPRCGYEGLAVVFDREEDYASFLRRLDLTWRASQGKRER